MGFFSKLRGMTKKATREAALSKGIRVEDVERGLPIFSRGGDLERVEKLPCVKYSVGRRPGAEPESWSFLQRSTRQGAQYPNGWLFQASQPPPPALHRALEKIASEWDEELLELEATRSEVSAFWEEWGGDEQVTRLQGYLESVSRT